MINNFLHVLKDKYENASIQVKASFWYSLMNIFQKAIMVIIIPILTRIMTAEQYGNYSVYLSWHDILLVFSSMNLYYAVLNNAMLKYPDKRDEYVSSMQGLVTFNTFALFLVFLIFRGTLIDIIGLPFPVICVMFIDLLLFPAFQLWAAKERFEYKYKAIVYITLANSFINPIVSVLCVFFAEDKLLARVISLVLINAIFYGIIYLYIFAKGKKFYNKEYWKYALLFNIPLLPHYLGGMILNQLDRIMIKNYVGEAQAAIYSVCYAMAMNIAIITNAINASFVPWEYNLLKNEDSDSIKKGINKITLFVVGIIAVVNLFAPEIMRIVAPKEYYEAVYFFPVLSASVLLIFLYNIFACVEFYYEEKSVIVISTVISAVLNYILNRLMIPMYGYVAACYTTVFCYLLYALLHFYFSKLIIKKKNMKSIYDVKFIVGTIIVMGILSALVCLLYDFTYIRIALIAVVIVLAIVKRKSLIGFYRSYMSK